MKYKKRSRRARGASSLEHLEARQLLAGDLVAHWLAQDLIGVVEEGQIPEAWVDRVGQVAATSEGGPAYISAAAGGRATLRFDDSDGIDLFRVTGEANPMAKAGDFTVVAVFETSSNAFQNGENWYDQNGIVDGDALSFAPDWGVAINQEGRITVGASGTVFGAPPSNLSSTETGLNDGQQHTVFFTRAGGTLGVSIDAAEASTIDGASDEPRDEFTAMVIGGLQVGRGGFTGDISEVRVYNGALSAEEISSVDTDIDSFYNNQPPAGSVDTYDINEDALLFTTGADGVLANDTDPDGDALTAVLLTDVRHGALGLNDDGSFIYDPDDNYFGVDTFTYAARDFRNSEPIEVTINIASAYDPVRPEPDSYKGLPSQPLQILGLIGIMANDINVDRASIEAELVQDVTNGSLTLTADGGFTYDPQGFAGTEVFQYRVADGTGFSEPETVTLVINTPPTAVDDALTLNEDEPLILDSANGVLQNDVDADGDSLTVELVETTTNGELTLSDDGSLSYVPNLDYVGSDAFTYRITDGVDNSSTVTAEISVVAVNDMPVAVSDVYFGVVDAPIDVVAEQGLLANDSDVDNSELTVALVESPANGTLTLNPDGSFQFVPTEGFSGEDTFSYSTSDGAVMSETTTVSLFVGQSPLRISEIMSASVDSIETRVRASIEDDFRGDEDQPDWIEIENLSTSPFDLGGYHLSNDQRIAQQWQFPAGSIVPANGHLLVFASDIEVRDPMLDEQGIVHTDFKLSLNGEYVALTSPNGAVLDEFEYPDQVPGVSYGLPSGAESRDYLVNPTPGTENSTAYMGLTPDTSFSVDRGYFTDPFTMEISTSDPAFEIRYTLDGTIPSATNGTVYSEPITVDRTTTLRAATVRDGYLTRDVDTQTYLFLDQVINQSAAPTTGPSTSPVSFPESWRSLTADYELDTEITTDPQYADKMMEALTSLPSLSVTLPMEDIFGDDGLYSNPSRTTEEATSAEFLRQDGTVGFQIDAGLRMQGGASRNVEHVKHSLSLRFREQYGAGELEYPLFDGSPVTTFNSIHLRARYNNSWIHWDQGQRNRGSMIREMWMRETMLAAGEVAAGHGRYVHLYLNGIYWGVYEMHERQDASHYANYFGGESHEYSATNANLGVDGVQRRPHEQLTDIVESLDWEQIQQVLDIDNHIRFSIVHQYGGNQDLKSDGNWRSAGAGTAGVPWQFYVWDAERVLENVNQRGTQPIGDLLGMTRDLLNIEEYRIRFADIVHELFFNGGALTAEETGQRWARLADSLDEALIAESARWGDLKQPNPLTLNDEWITERDRLLTEYFPARTDVVLENFRTRDDTFFRPRGDDVGYTLYPLTDAPEFLVGGQRQHGGFLNDQMLSIVNPNGDVGTVYFTVDGSDPRMVGGAVNPDAMVFAGEPIAIDGSARVRMRVLNDTEWSAISDATFSTEAPADSTNLTISEINYHPHSARPDAGEPNVRDREFEFIELRNTSDAAINLQGLQFIQTNVNGDTEGIVYRFGSHSLAPGASTLVVRNREAFLARYGSPDVEFDFASRADSTGTVGQWDDGSLGDGGEQITLVNAEGQVVQQLTYDDAGIWPDRADGDGSTLELVDSLGDLNAGANWVASSNVGGSPGTTSVLGSSTVLINELLTNSNEPVVDQIELYNSGPALDLSGWSLTDDPDRFDRYVFADGMTIEADGYLVLSQDQLGFGFKGQEADSLFLMTAGALSFADSVTFDATDADSTIGRWPNGVGDLFPQSSTSLGSANVGPRAPELTISEVHYNGGLLPDGATNEAAEFVEVWNAGTTPLEIGGWRLDKAVEFVFPAGTMLAANSGITLVSFDPAADGLLAEFQANFGVPAGATVMGPYTGILDNGGENLELQRPVDDTAAGFVLIDRVRYDDDQPWPLEADGSDRSLQRAANAFGNDPTSWTAAVPTPGVDNLGAIDPAVFDVTGDGEVNVGDVDQICQLIRSSDITGDLNGSGAVDRDDLLFLVQAGLHTGPGDTNLDGIFDSSDLESVFQQGEYEDATADNSTWIDGDWNCDGEFDTGDIVLAFTLGAYSGGNAAVAIDSSQDVAAGVIGAALAYYGRDSRDIRPTTSTGLLHAENHDEQLILQASRLERMATDQLFADPSKSLIIDVDDSDI